MSTHILIEKDNLWHYPVLVQVQEVDDEGHWVNIGKPEVLTAQFATTVKEIHQNRRLVVREAPTGNA